LPFLPIWFITESRIDTWIIAQGSMSNASICGRFSCSKKVEKTLVYTVLLVIPTLSAALIEDTA